MKRNSSNQQQSQFKTRFGNFDGDYMNEFVTPDGSLVSYQVLYIGWMLPKYTQLKRLKRNKRFDNFIMLVWIQGSQFRVAAGSHPVQEAWGSQGSLYRGQIQKLLQCCREPYQQIPLVITIQKKYYLTYLQRAIS